ncbi:MAG: AmmeMemoRadiSam system protein A [Anaerolineae bacterium]|nr:AmmeMemoRadiSam system protein A [Anaerolineae bacterium]
MAAESPHVRLAREAIRAYVEQGTVICPPDPLPPELSGRAGAFVSLHRGDDTLRGCIGTVEPTAPTLAEEIIQNAISAATRDPRFPPLRPVELEDLVISVDVLSEAEPVDSLDDLDAKHYGVIVQRDWRRGLLLPDLEGVETAQQQVAIAMQKAGISPHEEISLFRFMVHRHH